MSRKVAKEALEALVADRLKTKEIASIYGVDPRTVRRWLVGWEILPAQPKISVASRITPSVDAMLREGIPSTWAAEKTDISCQSIRDYARTLPERAGADREFKQIWPSIFNNPKLLDLHNQFAPTTIHGREP